METIKEKLLNELAKADTREAVEKIRIAFLGRQGIITNLNKNVDMHAMNADSRKAWGRNFNALKTWAEDTVAGAKANAKITLKADVDLTLPAVPSSLGSVHPISLVQIEIEQIFQGMGFTVGSGIHVESEYYNFSALNIPDDHPAREMQDTFWLTNGQVLRTHTSNMQVRMLQSYGAPLKAIFPGRCFRYEAVDASHENTFYQVEGIMVDHDISIANLIAIMRELLSSVFHQNITVRLRPGYFPFVEPGFELDCQCLICGGGGCKTCKNSGWIELLPCGMIHPKVLKEGGINPDEYTGFAFGLGLTRLAMMKYNIPEIRLFNSGEIDFLKQFLPALA
jgi:phenylalanyl-tRNA synthetase alpha chain